MQLRELLLTVHQVLEDAKISHALIGGMALSAHGYQRATNDVDFLVDGSQRNSAETAMTTRGFAVLYSSKEVVQWSGPGPVDFLFANRPISKEMLDRAKMKNILGIPVVDATDIIGLKIQAYMNNSSRELQDLADIQQLILKNNVDWERIESYAKAFGEWERIRKFKGE